MIYTNKHTKIIIKGYDRALPILLIYDLCMKKNFQYRFQYRFERAYKK